MTMGEAVYKRLESILNERKISLHKFLKDACISRTTIVNLKIGHTKSPTLSVVFQIAHGLGMSHLEFQDDPLFFNEELDYL